MNKFQRISLQANKKQIPLIRSLVATAKEYGVSAKEVESACAMANDLLMGTLVASKPLAEICNDVEAVLKNIQELG